MSFDWSNNNARFIDAFDLAAGNTPHAIAVEFNERAVSYRELQTLAKYYAHQFGTSIPDDVEGVVIHLPRSVELLAAILACQYIDLPYIPVDIRTARNRVEKILQASRYACVYDGTVTQGGFTQAFDVMMLQAQSEEVKENAFFKRCNPEAYRIYTSGSTGEPKAVRVTHEGCGNLIDHFSRLVSADRSMIWLSATSISFDIFYLEYTVPLANGGTLILLDEQKSRSAQEIARCLAARSPRQFQSTPSMLKCLLPYLPADWRFNKLLIGGEKLGGQLSEELYRRSAWLCNVYGPTETTVWSTAHVIQRPGDNRIGRPITETTVRILDAKMREVPQGVEGRIFIGGVGLALGYLNNPQLTAERFITFATEQGDERLYDTGDIGFIDNEGVICYCYRDGDFYKVNGYRIDCAEIVDAMEEIAGIDEAAVVVVEDEADDTATLVAWYKKREKTLESSVIRHQLERQLNHYMVPRYFFDTDEFPYSFSGKLDKKTITSMSVERIMASQHQGIAFARKINDVSDKIRNSAIILLSNYINIENMNFDDNFFHFGLSSMQAISFHLDLLELYPDLELHELFDRPTIKSLLDPCAEVIS